MNRTLMIKGFLFGCCFTALLVSFVVIPMVERSKDFGVDMANLYGAALDDISTLTEVCGAKCENVTLTYKNLQWSNE